VPYPRPSAPIRVQDSSSPCLRVLHLACWGITGMDGRSIFCAPAGGVNVKASSGNLGFGSHCVHMPVPPLQKRGSRRRSQVPATLTRWATVVRQHTPDARVCQQESRWPLTSCHAFWRTSGPGQRQRSQRIQVEDAPWRGGNESKTTRDRSVVRRTHRSGPYHPSIRGRSSFAGKNRIHPRIWSDHEERTERRWPGHRERTCPDFLSSPNTPPLHRHSATVATTGYGRPLPYPHRQRIRTHRRCPDQTIANELARSTGTP